MSVHRVYSLLIENYLLIDDTDHQLLSEFGLNTTQFSVLKLLDTVQGQRPIDLTAPLLIDKSSVTRLIDRLVEENLVQRISDPNDRRAQRVILTPKGVARREEARIVHEQSVTARLSVLDAEELTQLEQLLEKLSQHLLHLRH